MADVVLLATDCEATRVLYHDLSGSFPEVKVVLEPPMPRTRFLRYRLQKLGAWTVFGQLAFQIGVVPWLKILAKKRLAEIRASSGLQSGAIPATRLECVGPVNDEASIAFLRAMRPKVIVVSGTRILSKKLLESVPAVFLNMHAGITPRYRGVHGGYWALAAGDAKNCGVTVHLVDAGVDTGAVVAQDRIHPTATDSFVTYPILQLAAGVPLLRRAVQAALRGELKTLPIGNDPSHQWFHPTLWGYLRRRFRGVR